MSDAAGLWSAALLGAVSLLGGCAELGGVDRGPYTILEKNEVQQIGIVYFWTSVPIPVPAPSGSKVILVPTDKLSTARSGFVPSRPANRVLQRSGEGIVSVVRTMTAYVPEERVRFLIANDPLVVGIGTHTATPSTSLGVKLEGDSHIILPSNQRLITEGDMDEEITDMYAFDWATRATRRIPLEQPQTISALFQNRPWLQTK